jgi:LmbE family N-acetylglucosaminyl deacetylase
VVLSPHLDDAALSLGATIARSVRAGAQVTVLTAFAGDPESTLAAGEWDRQCGFASAGEAARRRRLEDSRACEILGATPDWLSFCDEEYPRGGNAEDVWSALAPKLAAADLVFAPGYPLENGDHAWLTRLLLERMPPELPVVFYVEQPYVNLTVIGRGYRRESLLSALRVALRAPAGVRAQAPVLDPRLAASAAAPVEWVAASTDRAARDAKRDAILAYRSQVDPLGGRLLVPRIHLYEWGWGGEGVGVSDRRRD